ncbi:MAG: GNAT family N-acetyltransferase [Pseudomonas sp.]
MQPTLHTPQLQLRPLAQRDASAIERLLQDREIAQMTSLIPFPYPPGLAGIWIGQHPQLWATREGAVWGICCRTEGTLMGVISLRGLGGATPELGYWLGKPFWGNGHATQAARRVCRYAIDELQIHALVASCLHRNIASAKVLNRVGFQVLGLGFELLDNKPGYEAVVYHRLE